MQIQKYYKNLTKLDSRKFSRNFVTLQVRMKKVVLNIVSFALAFWYSLSIIGFDVHTCNADGNFRVFSAIDEYSCSDAHPEHKCTEGMCVAQSGIEDGCESPFCGGVHLRATSCCSNDFYALNVTASRNDASSFKQNVRRSVSTVLYCDVLIPSQSSSIGVFSGHYYFRGAVFDSYRQVGVRDLSCVWRI